MAALDKSIFRERAIEKYMRRREIHVILRLVSPRMFLFLWALLLLALCGGAVVWSIQVPVLVQGKGMVVQQNTNNKQQNAQSIVVLLLLPPEEQQQVKVGQPVSISITGSKSNFTTTIQRVQTGVMSPTDIRNQFNLPAPLGQSVAAPAVVAIAQVQPSSQARTYLGSQCEAQVKIGSQSALSMVPILNNVVGYLDEVRALFDPTYKNAPKSAANSK